MREGSQPTVALLPMADRFEDFFPKIGVSLETFRDEYTGSWLFNYVDALNVAGIRSVLFVSSTRVRRPERFPHRPTGASICVLPSPRLHQKARGARERLLPRSRSRSLRSLESYLATPVRLLAQELRRERCDAVMCQEYEYTRFDICVLLGRLLRRPVFATFQGADSTASLLETPLRQVTVRSCAGLIVGAHSELERVRLRYRVPRARLAHIPNPLDVRTWRPQDKATARAIVGIPPAARVVVWHGRVQVPRKGLDVLLDAWRRVLAARPDSPLLLLLVGTGTDADVLRRRLGAFEPGTVHWIDRFVHDREVLRRYLSAADVSVLASRHEGFPVAAIEALACGLPLVAADVPGIADILEEGERSGGVVVPRGDAGSLADALLSVLDDESQRRELGNRARRRAEERFSLHAVGARLRDFLLSGTAMGAARERP